MSQQLFNMIAELRIDLEGAKKQIAELRSDVQEALASNAKLLEQRKEIAAEVKAFEKRFAPVEAMTAAIAEDARAILGATRDRIDPTKVKMPETLRRMGYGEKS